MTDELRAAHERGYIEGGRMHRLLLLQILLAELGANERRAHGWVVERQQALAVLRKACEEYGDNDWPDELSLGDVIEKHLLAHID